MSVEVVYVVHLSYQVGSLLVVVCQNFLGPSFVMPQDRRLSPGPGDYNLVPKVSLPKSRICLTGLVPSFCVKSGIIIRTSGS